MTLCYDKGKLYHMPSVLPSMAAVQCAAPSGNTYNCPRRLGKGEREGGKEGRVGGTNPIHPTARNLEIRGSNIYAHLCSTTAILLIALMCMNSCYV